MEPDKSLVPRPGLGDAVLTDGVISLRAPVESDAEVYASLTRASIDQLKPWMVWAHADYSAEEALGWINGEHDPSAHAMVIIDAAGEIVGSSGLNQVQVGNGGANLGYWVAGPHTGRGYATRATNLVLRYAIEQVGLHRVEVIMSVENQRSRAVAERSMAIYEGDRRGYLRYDGRNHDVHCYVLLAPDLEEIDRAAGVDRFL